MINPQLSGKALTRGISNGRVLVQDGIDLDVTQIVKRAEKIGNQFGVVSDVFKAADGFELARQVI